MTTLKKLREELEALKAELQARLEASPEASAAKAKAGEKAEELKDALEGQMAELHRLTKVMLEEAETTVADHPMATVAGALALGIVIGRITAR
ncbi:MAG: DUF883 family protein [Alphaproteobacteria bacterium]|nr:DUF883 family protein [Alphaproteobacteria bacterium]